MRIYEDDDGQFVIASWDDQRAQFTAYSPVGKEALGSSYHTTYGRTLGQLRQLGVPAYATLAAAYAAQQRRAG